LLLLDCETMMRNGSMQKRQNARTCSAAIGTSSLLVLLLDYETMMRNGSMVGRGGRGRGLITPFSERAPFEIVPFVQAVVEQAKADHLQI